MAMLQADKLKIAKNLRMAINNAVPIVSAFPQVLAHVDLPDEEAVEYKDLYPEWEPYQKYKTDEILRHNDELYRVIANINKNDDVEPGTEAGNAYFQKIVIAESGYQKWEQPTDNKTGYSKGDIVEHNGTLWQSDKNNNIDEPGTSNKWIAYNPEKEVIE